MYKKTKRHFRASLFYNAPATGFTLKGINFDSCRQGHKQKQPSNEGCFCLLLHLLDEVRTLYHSCPQN